jgi:FAD/FMN-containing dehydrogenase/Fe-S oxidoreductase
VNNKPQTGAGSKSRSLIAVVYPNSIKASMCFYHLGARFAMGKIAASDKLGRRGMDGKINFMALPPEFIHELQIRTQCDIRTDRSTRWLYSTDASIYQIDPLGVAFPHTLDDLTAVVALASQYHIPVVARGAGSSLAGQAIGTGLIIDCSRHLTEIHEINVVLENDRVKEGQVTAEPGIVLNSLNRAAAQYGLQFGPDPASAERATLGGSLANNATGAHSILYGMSADHLLSAEVILADGSVTNFSDREINNGSHLVSNTLESCIYAAAVDIRENYAEAIHNHWPKVWRRASGYNLNYLLPWSPAIPPGWQFSYNTQAIYNHLQTPTSSTSINLAPLIAGSEGTLAIIRCATLQLVPIPHHTILGVLAYDNMAEACDAVPGLLEQHHPSAVELISQLLIQLARSVPAYASQLSWVKTTNASGDDPAALLVIEFSGDDEKRLHQQVNALGPNVLVADTPALQKQVWAVRKVGLGILQSRPGDRKPATFIEDLAVPVERLGEFVREMERIMFEHHTVGDFYAHASAGCLHFRPLLNIKTSSGIAEMRSIAEEAVNLVLRLGGATSGEHGDGISRSEWLERAYGVEIVKAFRKLKAAADPYDILNPGKIIDPLKMDENLRIQPVIELAWNPVLDFTRNGGAAGPGGLMGAVEMCNGAGVCRKTEDVMCPSFQATQDETFSTRGRANLLRATMAPVKPTSSYGDNGKRRSIGSTEIGKVWESLDMCLACKGCKSECPSGVDMAKLKYEYMHHYYTTHHRRLRDYLFGYIGVVAPLGVLFAPIINWIMGRQLFRRGMERFFGLSCQRPFPRFASRSAINTLSSPSSNTFVSDINPTVLFLRDTFNHYFYPEVETAALRLLAAVNVDVKILPVIGAGRTLISKGFLPAAKKHAARVIDAICRADPEGNWPIIGLEPSEIYTLRDEFLDFFPEDERVSGIAERVWMIDEFLIRANKLSQFTSLSPKVILHGHCYQKSRPPAADGFPIGVGATVELLKVAGYTVEVVDDGCCGMAGAFGYEVEHFNTSTRIGELVLFPSLMAVKQAGLEVFVSAPGVSCRAQIEDGTGFAALHPVQLVERAMQ